MFTQPYRYDSQMAFCGHLIFAITTTHMAFLASAASQKEKERKEKTLYRPVTSLGRKF
jgi:hypothetical protein